MGMFDYVVVSDSLLPEDVRSKFKTGHLFQTKCFDCMMDTVTITEEKELTITKGYGLGWVPDGETIIKIPFHGYFNFYTHDHEMKWCEFKAKFTDGKLIEIKQA